MKTQLLKKLILPLFSVILFLTLLGAMVACQGNTDQPQDSTEDSKIPDTEAPIVTDGETEGETLPPAAEPILFKAGEGIVVYDA